MCEAARAARAVGLLSVKPDPGSAAHTDRACQSFSDCLTITKTTSKAAAAAAAASAAAAAAATIVTDKCNLRRADYLYTFQHRR